jgi:hypothetical protein
MLKASLYCFWRHNNAVLSIAQHFAKRMPLWGHGNPLGGYLERELLASGKRDTSNMQLCVEEE